MARDGARTRGLGLGWLASGVLALVMGVLLFVVTLEIRSGHLPAMPTTTHVDCSSQQAKLGDQIAQATTLLQASGLPLPSPVEETQGADRLRYVHRRYELNVPEQPLGDLEQRLRSLREHDPCVSVDVAAEDGGARIKVGIDEVLTHTVLLHWVVPTPQRVRLAIVIEDLGGDLLSAREFTTIEAPIAFAIVPHRPFSKEVAELAHLFQREVLLDLRRDVSADEEAPATPAAVGDDAAYQQLDDALATVPYVIGVKQPARLAGPSQSTLGWLKLHQLCFIGDAAALDHDARQVAAALGIAVADHRIVLDEVPDDVAVRAQLDALVKLAHARGTAVGIGHAHVSTANALRAVLPQWRDAGIEVVPVSAVVVAATLAPE